MRNPQNKVLREFSEEHRECASCLQPIIPGELSFREEVTGCIGCCSEHVIDAALHAEDTKEARAFKIVFENNDENTAREGAQ